MSDGVRLQPLVRARVAQLGEAGRAWAAGLAPTLATLAEQWELRLGRAMPGGSAAYVVAADTRDGRSVVVKIMLPGLGFAGQVATLARASGAGYAELLAVDHDRHALLLERLGPSLARSDRPVPDQLRILADTLAAAWLPAGDRPVLAKAAELAELIRRSAADQPGVCSDRVVEQALRYAARRAAEPGEPVVVHGDPHPGNALAARQPRPGAESGYCFVDPDGFVGERAYDLGVVLRDWCGQLSGPDARRTAEAYCRQLADRTGVDVTAIWEWGFLERVSTGLYVTTVVGAPAVGRPYLSTAVSLAD